MPTPSILRFRLVTTAQPRDLWKTFMPQGKTVLNRTEWRGKEPRTCGINRINIHDDIVDGKLQAITEIEVAYRPAGHISFVGDTKYNGWTLVVPDRNSDGTYLDGAGKPLPPDKPPVFLRFEVYQDIEFNDIDFGELVSETPVSDNAVADWQTVFKEFVERTHDFGMSMVSRFLAPHRQRPRVKIAIGPVRSGVSFDGFGTRVTVINSETPRLEQVLLDEVTELVSGFVEGRYSLHAMTSGDRTLLNLSSLLVDQRPLAHGGEPIFDALAAFVTDDWLVDLASRLSSTYQVKAMPVSGEAVGLELRMDTSADR